MWWILVAASVVALGYWLLIRPFKYWVDRGVKQGNPKPIFGDDWGPVLRKQSWVDMVTMVYNDVQKTRYSGFYQFSVPSLLIKDPDLIKQITVKDFDHFMDHQLFVSEDVDPLWGKNLLALNGKRWREMRSTLSPAFTSSKMKYMFSLISQSGEQFVKYFLKKEEDVITVEMKDTFTRFTNDVIGSTAFGVECDSLGDRRNEFYLMGKEATDLSGFWTNFKFYLFFFAPKLCKVMKWTFFSKKVANFFTNLVATNIASRQKHNIMRPDMLNLLLEARKHGLKHEDAIVPDAGFATVKESESDDAPVKKLEITDVDIVAQALIFFFGGFESVSSLMCFMSYELGIHPDIQERLIREVDETLEACNGKLTYEATTGMKYMDMVVSETLRKWPINLVLDRICTKPYTIQPKYPDERPVHLEKDMIIWIPAYPIHRDPKYYPDPEKFDPERFSDENKGNINPYTYLPFGSGPRNCIGSRFAILEIKILFFYILSHFEIVPVEKTQIPLVLSKTQFSLAAEDGFWLGFKRRCKPNGIVKNVILNL